LAFGFDLLVYEFCDFMITGWFGCRLTLWCGFVGFVVRVCLVVWWFWLLLNLLILFVFGYDVCPACAFLVCLIVVCYVLMLVC